MRPTAALLLSLIVHAAGPHLARVSPLGGQAGSTVEVELTGDQLASIKSVRFDTPDIEWLGVTAAAETTVKGRIRIAPAALLGPHRIQIITANGPTNSRLFNVNQFPSTPEVEPVQTIELKPQVVHGYMQNLADQDFLKFRAKAGERWLFDLQSIERGGFLECSLSLYDGASRELAYNEDQDEYLETPRLSFTFPKDGEYTLKIDQYRGPQGTSCSKNCGYQLQISRLPVVTAMFPLGARPGAAYKVRIHGEALESAQSAYLQRVRAAEHYRLTFPFSMPVDGSDAVPPAIRSQRLHAHPGHVDVEFQIPANAAPGLWRLWLVTRHGIAEAMSLEVDPDPATIDAALTTGPNKHPVELHAGVPFHAWTLAAQLGLPAVDTVLELWSPAGKLLAEHDDLMTGQGTVIGNPDSSLYYLPTESGPATLTVRDRTNRTGPGFAYRLHQRAEAPSFQLLYEPEELSVKAGQEVEFEALLIKQPGFEKAVDVWVEGHPEARGQFRADQHFGPSGDGDNINIPIVNLKLRIPPNTPPGDYPIHLRARAAGATGPIVDALSTLWIGPNGKRNDTRRPLPRPAAYIR